MNSKTIDIIGWYGSFQCSSCGQIYTRGVATLFEIYRGVTVKIALCKACAKDYADRLIKKSERSDHDQKDNL